MAAPHVSRKSLVPFFEVFHFLLKVLVVSSISESISIIDMRSDLHNGYAERSTQCIHTPRQTPN